MIQSTNRPVNKQPSIYGLVDHQITLADNILNDKSHDNQCSKILFDRVTGHWVTGQISNWFTGGPTDWQIVRLT